MNEKTKKLVNIGTKVTTWLLIAFTVFMMIFTIFSTLTFDRNDRNLFGMRFYIVVSDSMSPSENNKDDKIHFNAGDIVLIKDISDNEKAELKAGDVIAFLSTNSVSYGETVTHMIREVKYNDEGKIVGFVTYGTNTGTNDEKVVEPEYILGQYTGKLPGVGNFFVFVKSTPGYIVCILVPFLLLILYNGVNVIRLFRQYKKEQTAAMEAERAEIAEERKKNEDMLRELQALKEQLERQNGGTPTETPPAETENRSDT